MSSDLVACLRRILEPRSDVRLALLFGSVARGVAGADSDVDVAVDAPGVDRLALARDLTLALEREADVVELTDLAYPLLSAIVRDGIVVAEHERGAAARWRTHALISLDNDRVWYERMRDAYLAHLAAGGRDG